ncbi:MAG TPA: hypothetical protein VFG19_11625 [Geobacteraceae bacterium]|nr:hypothetical protein [Geobacteraceae bacterium]
MSPGPGEREFSSQEQSCASPLIRPFGSRLGAEALQRAGTFSLMEKGWIFPLSMRERVE